MTEEISPRYLMKLVESIDKALWQEYSSYRNVQLYLKKWQEYDGNWPDFQIQEKEEGKIDCIATLHRIENEKLLRIAIDLGVETPDFIPCIPEFRNVLKASYSTASATFEKAIRQLEEHPDLAVGLANSALESIIKEILADSRFENTGTNNKTLYKLTEDLLKEFSLFPNANMPIEIRSIGSALLKINQNVEKLRSEKTNLHGKINSDYVIGDALYAYLIVNSVATVGLFLKSYHEKIIKRGEPVQDDSIVEDDLPF